tara:strand:- start:564 stop:848 length:285 start_codon:yes stop_codon:yes gene_type:complete
MLKGKQYRSGKQVFREHLNKLPRQLTHAQILEAFGRLFDRLEQSDAELGALSVIKRAETLAPDFPVCAYGYPKTYMSVLAGDISRQRLTDLLSE